MSVAMMPRVRVVAICDEALASEIEAGVFTLESVRYDGYAETFPHVRDLSVYLQVSYYRAGTFSGTVSLDEDATGRTIRYERFNVSFDGTYELTSLVVAMSRCVFTEAGYYTVLVHLSRADADDKLLAQLPLVLWGPEGSV